MDAIENVVDLSPTDRRREVAALLAKGVARWRKPVATPRIGAGSLVRTTASAETCSSVADR